MRLFDKYYYIVYFRDFITPPLYPVYFTNRQAAKRAIRATVSKNKRVFYDVIKGSKLKDFELQFMFSLGNLGKFTKYEYPSDMRRKSFRTKMRRRLRRMGMLTPAMNKYSVKKSSPYIKVIQNRQKVANSPNTIAKAFRLERKPKHIYYLIQDKKLSKKKGILFEIDALMVNMKTKAVIEKRVQVYRNDIVIPYLTTEIHEAYGGPIKL